MFFSILVFIILCLSIQTNANENISLSPSNNCSVKYGENLLKDGEVIAIKLKLYKVEDCQLQRAYHVCGPYLWFMIDIVCKALELDDGAKRFKKYVRRFTQQKLLSEACCLTACTISEMALFCS
jgi:hypothetical protein